MEYKKYSENTGDFADAWAPAADEKIEGVVQEIATIEGKFGPYPCITIVTADGTRVAVHAARSVLRDQTNGLINKHDLKVGDTYGAHYVGPVKSKTGNTYHDYNVAYEPAAAGTPATAAPAAPTPTTPAATADEGPDF
jgi:hypothetical protein